MPSVLWWGRSDSDYSRNRIVNKYFLDLGWTVRYFHPFISQLGMCEAYIRRPARPDLIWVPCFRHKDILSASHWSRKWGIPLVIDPLISSFEKDIHERNKYPLASKNADKLKQWEQTQFLGADILIADTPAHADYFHTTFHVPAEKIEVLYVSAEIDIFKPASAPPDGCPLEILFYGSYLKLQGVETIIRAAEITQDLNAVWVLLGQGEYRKSCEQLAQGMKNVRFEDWIAYDYLPNRIAQSHILLGIFGSSIKAGLVIPNKLFQAMAVGRPVITRKSPAYKDTLGSSDIIGWVPPEDPKALAFLVRKWFEEPLKLARRGEETRLLFDRFFSEDKQTRRLANILSRALTFIR